MAYRDAGATVYDERNRGRVIANLQRRARSMGYELVPMTAGHCVS